MQAVDAPALRSPAASLLLSAAHVRSAHGQEAGKQFFAHKCARTAFPLPAAWLNLFLHICKFCVSGEPGKLYGSDGAVSLLGYDDFRHILAVGVLVVIIVAVEEHYHVRILLDGSRLTQVGKHGAVVRPLLHRAGQL